VVGVDIDRAKLDLIAAGKTPVVEEGMVDLMAQVAAAGRVMVTTDVQQAVRDTDISLVCVGTPSAANGNLNLDYLRKVSSEIGNHIDGRAKPLTVVVRSTVFPGSCDEVVSPHIEPRAMVVSNPEFLREGSAVKDFMEPSLVVVGSHDRTAAERVAALYSGLPVQTSVVALRTAELIKYTCNTFHALKIAFANEIGTLSASLGLDGAEVMETVCKDTKLNISKAYMKPGFAFGGSCLPKDLRGLNYRARQLDLDLPLLNSVLPSNEAHISRAFQRIMETGSRKIGVYGLSFKPNTDDLRESPGVALIERLIGKGIDVKVFDPYIQLDAIYGSNLSFLLGSLPHIGRSMEKSLEGILGWAELIVVTQDPNTESRRILDGSAVPVINVARAEVPSAQRLEPVR